MPTKRTPRARKPRKTTRTTRAKRNLAGREEFRDSRKMGIALISGVTFKSKSVTYYDVGGVAMVEGDIVLGNVEDVQKATAGGRSVAGDPNLAFGIGITGRQLRWQNGEVPYEIDPALPNQNRVTDAIAHWEANTPIRFPLRTTANSQMYPNFVRFTDTGAPDCSSFVGMQGGQQTISLESSCAKGEVMHEIGHAVGLWHEQSREDRDLYVTINWANIKSGKSANFNQQITDGDDVGPYDYGSIMHYSRTEFSKGGDTITPTNPKAQIGQRVGLSAGDIAAVREMYRLGAWASLGGSWPSLPAVGVNGDGRLEVFLVNSTGQLYHRWQVSAGGGWSDGWQSLGGSWPSTPAVGVNRDGRLEVFVVGITRELYHRWQVSAGGEWSDGWESLGGSWPSTPAVGVNRDGRLEVFVVGNTRELYHRWQVGTGGWSDGWESLGGSWPSTPAVGVNRDGRLEVFVVGNTRELYHRWQVGTGGWSDGWESLGGSWPSTPAVGVNRDGRLEVFVVGNTRELYHRWQVGTGGWSDGWESLGGTWLIPPAVGVNRDGRLEVFVGVAMELYHRWQVSAGGGWSDGWQSLGGVWSSTPAVAVNRDGRLEVFAVGGTRELYHRWQDSPGDLWRPL